MLTTIKMEMMKVNKDDVDSNIAGEDGGDNGYANTSKLKQATTQY